MINRSQLGYIDSFILLGLLGIDNCTVRRKDKMIVFSCDLHITILRCTVGDTFSLTNPYLYALCALAVSSSDIAISTLFHLECSQFSVLLISSLYYHTVILYIFCLSISFFFFVVFCQYSVSAAICILGNI